MIDIVKKMGSVWEKRVEPLAVSFFGKRNIKQVKPTKKYSEQELYTVLANEVREKIKVMGSQYYFDTVFTTSDKVYDGYGRGGLHIGESCPRCLKSTFGHKNLQPFPSFSGSFGNSNLYKCTACGLELTQKEFDIAKELTFKSSVTTYDPS